MAFLYALAAIALAYLAGGLLTTIAAFYILWSQSRNITIGDLAVLPKVFVLWPAVVAMGVVFAVIMLAQRRHFAQEAKKAKKSHDPTGT
ncbi:MAG: hypothetical protein L0211_11985 [Planctomycetaceae bacterium]|nr:hypothetical protein [Planctomycetaceae bacterium]